MNEMEMKNGNKSNVILIGIILLIIGLAVGGGITALVLSKNDNSNDTKCVKEENNTQSKNEELEEENVDEMYTYESLSGKYEFMIEKEKNEIHTLYLYENGNFWYDICEWACYGSAGNYIIKDDKVVLNKIINFGSDAETHIAETEMEEELTIEKNNLKKNKEDNIITFDKTKTGIKNLEYFDKLNQRIFTTKATQELG